MRTSSGIARRSLVQFSKLSLPSRCTLTPFLQPSLPRVINQLQRQSIPRHVFARYNSSLAVPESENKSSEPAVDKPSYQLTFTCKPCRHRSSHTISKQGYHKGTVLITCPSCRNRHVISDHLKIFMDEKSTLEDILKRSAPGGDLSKLLKKGRLGMREGALVGNEGEEDIEFWEDGTETTHQRSSEGTSAEQK